MYSHFSKHLAYLSRGVFGSISLLDYGISKLRITLIQMQRKGVCCAVFNASEMGWEEQSYKPNWKHLKLGKTGITVWLHSVSEAFQPNFGRQSKVHFQKGYLD